MAERFTYGPAPTGFADLRLPSGSGPHLVVILIHGGFWRARYGLDLMARLGDDLAARGVATWNIEYRRVGERGGGYPGTLIDVATAAERLRVVAADRPLDLARVITLGHSAGGHLALWLAARHRLSVGALGPGAAATLTGPDTLPLVGAISQAGVSDLTAGWRQQLGNGAVSDFIGGGADEFPERYAVADPALSLPLGVPQVLVHGLLDDIVPPSISELYLAAATKAGDDARLRAIPDADHKAVIDPTTPAWVVIVEEVRRLLGLG